MQFKVTTFPNKKVYTVDWDDEEIQEFCARCRTEASRIPGFPIPFMNPNPDAQAVVSLPIQGEAVEIWSDQGFRFFSGKVAQTSNGWIYVYAITMGT